MVRKKDIQNGKDENRKKPTKRTIWGVADIRGKKTSFYFYRKNKKKNKF